MTTAADICRHCGSSDVIVGDGIDVCDPCITRLTVLAAEPERGTDAELGRLMELHAGTVRLTGDPLRWERIAASRYYSGDRG